MFPVVTWNEHCFLNFFSNNGAAFVCELIVFTLWLTAKQTVMDGENEPSTKLQTDITHTAAGGQAGGLWTQMKKGLLPILFLPANRNRKEKEFYWGKGDQR